jgi:tRNA (guanine-N(7)-)-methyltransferase
MQTEVSLQRKDHVRRLSSRVNRYFDRLFEFPDTLIPGFNLEQDVKDLRLLLEKYREAPLVIEFGSGSGGHLAGLARCKPDAMVLGFEVRFKRSVRTVEKALQSGLNNLYVFRGRSELASRILGERKADEVYINFPDPWEKKRWRKHRILSSENLRMISGMLHDNGVLSVKTDHREYFDSFIQDLQSAVPELPFVTEQLTHDLQECDCMEAEIKTEFEQLFRSQQKPICYARLRRTELQEV